jgi:glycosyltransferase involved in cell wall biosynthesis
MRLTLVITSLGRGGAERTTSVLANAWASRDNEVTLITLIKDDVPAYALHQEINLRQLRVRGGTARNLVHGIIRQLRSVRTLRRAIHESRPDLIISVMDISNILTLFAARGASAPVVIVEQTYPEYYPIGWAWETLRRFTYRWAGMLVCTSKPMMEWLRRKTKAKACVIPNPIDLPPQSLHDHSPQGESGRIIIGMGRLVPEKGFDLLLQAFSRIASRHPDWSLQIVGEGVLREALQAQSVDLKISERVEFVGWLQDPFSALRAADLFVFSSRFEGFGNALCEAMACGLPVISFNCPSGPGEIIRHGIDGILVPPEDVEALSVTMDRLMGDAQERAHLAARAPEVIVRFGLERIMGLWDQLFARLLPKSSDADSARTTQSQ